jgi:hypothetical protein
MIFDQPSIRWHKLWQISVLAGLCFDLRFGSILIAPYVFTEIPISKANIHFHWYSYYLTAGIDLMLRL